MWGLAEKQHLYACHSDLKMPLFFLSLSWSLTFITLACKILPCNVRIYVCYGSASKNAKTVSCSFMVMAGKKSVAETPPCWGGSKWFTEWYWRHLYTMIVCSSLASIELPSMNTPATFKEVKEEVWRNFKHRWKSQLLMMSSLERAAVFFFMPKTRFRLFLGSNISFDIYDCQRKSHFCLCGLFQ